jgi:hypothetical protein
MERNSTYGSIILGALNREHSGTSVPVENLGLGCFVSNGHVTGIPSQYSIDTILIIMVKWSDFIATTIIDLEGQAGIYTRRREEDEFKKQ